MAPPAKYSLWISTSRRAVFTGQVANVPLERCTPRIGETCSGKAPLALEKHVRGKHPSHWRNMFGESTPRIGETCSGKAPLGLRKHPRGKHPSHWRNMFGESTPRIGETCSGKAPL